MSGPARRGVALALVLLAACAGLVGCGGKGDKDFEVVQKALAKTRLQARAFRYEDHPLGGSTLGVVGEVEDDYRFTARLTVDGAGVREEVASDDALAVRFLDPSKLGLAVDPAALAAAQARAAKAPARQPGDPAPLALPIDALQAGRWVYDPVGAPSLLPRADKPRYQGEDPLLDGLTAIDYVSAVVTAAGRGGVVRYNKQALSPTYKPKEDPFPQPDLGAALVRYDIRLRDFPKARDISGKDKVLVPEVENFRKMAIYVKGGVVVEVREDIDVANRLDALRKAFDLPGQITVGVAVQAINEVRTQKGLKEPFRPRTMQVTFTSIGSIPDPIALPEPAEYVTGDLRILKGRGAQKATSTASTTTTAAPTAAG